MELKGFTEQEAIKYIEQKVNGDKLLTFEQIKEVGGTSPLLLLHLNKHHRLSEYRAQVNIEVINFLDTDLSVKQGDTNSVLAFLERGSYKTCDTYLPCLYRR